MQVSLRYTHRSTQLYLIIYNLYYLQSYLTIQQDTFAGPTHAMHLLWSAHGWLLVAAVLRVSSKHLL